MLEPCSNRSNAFGGKRRFLNVAGSKLVTGLRAEGAADRLRELARRQNDLNKRLKELQSALQEAANEQEREEIQRQLKRRYQRRRTT